VYTDLKDANAVINSVCWKGSVSKLAVKPEEGLDVICTGKITTYPLRSNYQLVIETMELAGVGALLKMLEERRKRLEAEGLFDSKRKRPLPFIPERIGIITSPTGAVIKDMLHRLADRFPRHVLVWPVNVQGDMATPSIVKAIEGFNSLNDDLRPDVLIVARGGGSLEDLMPFNDEAIVRAVANSKIPVISAIGHETDTTLIDYAADCRAPTPSAAAEMVVPVLSDLVDKLNVQNQRLYSLVTSKWKHDRNEVRRLQASLGDPQNIIRMQQQRLDHISTQALHGLKTQISDARHDFTRIQGQLRHPKQLLDLMTQKLTGLSQLMESYSFKNVLARGFAYVTNTQDKVMDTKSKAEKETTLNLRFADGTMTVRTGK
jgi:exodeoxyribonuclease VII large subunit